MDSSLTLRGTVVGVGVVSPARFGGVGGAVGVGGGNGADDFPSGRVVAHVDDVAPGCAGEHGWQVVQVRDSDGHSAGRARIVRTF